MIAVLDKKIKKDCVTVLLWLVTIPTNGRTDKQSNDLS